MCENSKRTKEQEQKHSSNVLSIFIAIKTFSSIFYFGAILLRICLNPLSQKIIKNQKKQFPLKIRKYLNFLISTELSNFPL